MGPGLTCAALACSWVHTGCDARAAGADATIDTRADTGDAPFEPVLLRAMCTYTDYGSQCRTSCDLDPEVPIQLLVTWSEPYCCGFPTRSDESFYDCRCIEGEVRCNRFSSDHAYGVPTSTCEGCPGTGSGWMSPDAGAPDTGIDAGPDDGAGDVGSSSDAG